ncbi:MAG: GIY-YIG nuclease family protein [Bacteroidota bacterium]
MYVVYVLYSKDFDRYYVGMTTNLVRRLQEHNTGRTKSTKAYMPWHIVYKKTFAESTEARAWEKYLKTASGRRWRKENIRPRSSTG